MAMARRSLCLLMLLMLSKGLRAHEQELWVLTDPEAPFAVMDEKSRLSGYAVDLVSGVLDVAGIKQQPIFAPWSRALRMAMSEPNVLFFSVARTPEREDLFYWITPVSANRHGIFSLKPHPQVSLPQGLNDLKRIGVQKGDFRDQLLHSWNLPAANEFNGWDEVVRSWVKGEVDAIFFSHAGLKHYCWQLQVNCDAMQEILPYQVVTTYLVLSKAGTEPHLATELQQAATAYKQTAHYQRMAQSWLKEYHQSATIDIYLQDGVMNMWRDSH